MKPKTVGDALSTATRYWETNERVHRGTRGPNMMPIRAQRCASLLGLSRKLSSLGPEDGTALLTSLRLSGLARSTVGSYYAAGLRMLGLSGLSTHDWPKAPSPPRQLRQPLTEPEIAKLVGELEAAGHGDTASLVQLMRDTGLRVNVEALKGDWAVQDGRLHVRAGKGGHARVVPYKGDERGPLGGVTYETHLRRIKAAGALMGRPDVRPHDLRRAFVKRAYEGSGKDIRVAQVLAGHASPETTAGYIGVDYAELEKALGS